MSKTLNSLVKELSGSEGFSRPYSEVYKKLYEIAEVVTLKEQLSEPDQHTIGRMKAHAQWKELLLELAEPPRVGNAKPRRRELNIIKELKKDAQGAV